MSRSRFVIALTVAYAIAIFITSDKSLRMMSMTICNLLSIVMAFMLFSDSLREGRQSAKNPVLAPLIAAVAWAALSLLISQFNPATSVSQDASLYAWAVGVSSPEYRGIAYLVRFLLAICAFHFVFRVASRKENYFSLLKAFSWGYLIFCTITLGQILAYHFWGYSFGKVFVDSIGRVRIGSYVGEPSVMSALMVSGYFLFSPFLALPKQWRVIPPFLRWYGFIAATISLFYAMSAAIISSIIIVFALSQVKRARGLLLAGVFLFMIFLLPTVGDRLSSNPVVSKIRTELTTVNIRSFSWLIGYRMFMASPFTGVGIGRTPFFVEQYMPTDVEINFDIASDFNYTEMRHTAMNSYMEWLDETGFIGGLILIWAFYVTYRVQKSVSATETCAARAAFGMPLLALLISANSFPGVFYLSHFGFVFAMYLAGLRQTKCSGEAVTA